MTDVDDANLYPPPLAPPVDWRGTPVRTGSVVVFCNANGPSGKPIRWKLGTVQDVFVDDTYGTWEWLLRMRWLQDSWTNTEGRRHGSSGSRGVRLTSVTVLNADLAADMTAWQKQA